MQSLGNSAEADCWFQFIGCDWLVSHCILWGVWTFRQQKKWSVGRCCGTPLIAVAKVHLLWGYGECLVILPQQLGKIPFFNFQGLLALLPAWVKQAGTLTCFLSSSEGLDIQFSVPTTLWNKQSAEPSQLRIKLRVSAVFWNTGPS